jgi:hypothetical protein
MARMRSRVAAHQRVGLRVGVGEDDITVGANACRTSVDRPLGDRALTEGVGLDDPLASGLGQLDRVGSVRQYRDVARRKVSSVDDDHLSIVA